MRCELRFDTPPCRSPRQPYKNFDGVLLDEEECAVGSDEGAEAQEDRQVTKASVPRGHGTSTLELRRCQFVYHLRTGPHHREGANGTIEIRARDLQAPVHNYGGIARLPPDPLLLEWRWPGRVGHR